MRVRVNACMCSYDEQSQICMDTVIGILSVFSCSLMRERGLDGRAGRIFGSMFSLYSVAMASSWHPPPHCLCRMTITQKRRIDAHSLTL